jgi:nitrate reductase assembly molybdenum cofactor insertion protein NarJ
MEEAGVYLQLAGGDDEAQMFKDQIADYESWLAELNEQLLDGQNAYEEILEARRQAKKAQEIAADLASGDPAALERVLAAA